MTAEQSQEEENSGDKLLQWVNGVFLWGEQALQLPVPWESCGKRKVGKGAKCHLLLLRRGMLFLGENGTTEIASSWAQGAAMQRAPFFSSFN